MFDNIKQKISSKIYDLERQDYIRKAIGKYGDIKEEDDRIIVYANQKLVNKNGKNILYDLCCNDISSYYAVIEEIVEKYNLGKPVYYIFDGIEFNCFVQLYGGNVVFKNCSFVNGLSVNYCNNLTLENNKYYQWTDYYTHGKAFLNGVIGELTIKNDDFINLVENKQFGETKFGIDVEASKINLDNSDIITDDYADVVMQAKKINIVNSKIFGSDVYLDSNSISAKKSILKASNGIIIENPSTDFNGYVLSPTVVYNGVDFNASSNVIKINESFINTVKAKNQLFKILKELRNRCQEVNLERRTEILTKLDSQSVSKVLKKF